MQITELRLELPEGALGNISLVPSELTLLRFSRQLVVSCRALALTCSEPDVDICAALHCATSGQAAGQMVIVGPFQLELLYPTSTSLYQGYTQTLQDLIQLLWLSFKIKVFGKDTLIQLHLSL